MKGIPIKLKLACFLFENSGKERDFLIDGRISLERDDNFYSNTFKDNLYYQQDYYKNTSKTKAEQEELLKKFEYIEIDEPIYDEKGSLAVFMCDGSFKDFIGGFSLGTSICQILKNNPDKEIDLRRIWIERLEVYDIVHVSVDNCNTTKLLTIPSFYHVEIGDFLLLPTVKTPIKVIHVNKSANLEYYEKVKTEKINYLRVLNSNKENVLYNILDKNVTLTNLYSESLYDNFVDQYGGDLNENADCLLLSQRINHNKNNNLKTKKIMNFNNNNDSFSKMGNTMMSKMKNSFMPVVCNDLRISSTGDVCFINKEGEAITIDTENNLMAYPDFMALKVPVYAISRPIEQLVPGDIIKDKNSYCKVLSIKNNNISCISFSGTKRVTRPITDFLLNQTNVKVIINMFANMGNTMGGMNPMMLAMMNNESGEGEEGGDNSEAMMMMFVMSSMGQMNGMGGMNQMGGNPMSMMMPMMMMQGNNGDGSGNNMMETMMMMQFMQQGQMGGNQMNQPQNQVMQSPFGNMFGQSVPVTESEFDVEDAENFIDEKDARIAALEAELAKAKKTPGKRASKAKKAKTAKGNITK